MSRILHDWPDERALTLLRNCRKVMPARGALLLREVVLAEENTTGQGPTGLDLMMMAIPGGRERTQQEWYELLHEAGLRAASSVDEAGGPDLLRAARTPPREVVPAAAGHSGGSMVRSPFRGTVI